MTTTTREEQWLLVMFRLLGPAQRDAVKIVVMALREVVPDRL